MQTFAGVERDIDAGKCKRAAHQRWTARHILFECLSWTATLVATREARQDLQREVKPSFSEASHDFIFSVGAPGVGCVICKKVKYPARAKAKVKHGADQRSQ